MRKAIVVIRAAMSPAPRVSSEGRRDVPFDPRRRMNSEIKSARKVSPVAMGWSTRAAVSALEIMFSWPRICNASETALSKEYPSLALEHEAAVEDPWPTRETSIPDEQYPQTPNLTDPVTSLLRRLELTSTAMRKRKIVLMIGTDRETRRSKRKAIKSRTGVKEASILQR